MGMSGPSRVSKLVLAFVTAMLLMAAPALAQTKPKWLVRFSANVSATDAGVVVADKYGFFKESGIDLKYVHLDNAAALIAAVATDKVDVGGLSLTPGLFASQGQGIALKIVGDKQSIAPGFAAEQLLVQADLGKGGEAAILDRLKGHTIAVSGKTSGSYFLLNTVLAKYGHTIDQYKIVEMNYPSMLPAIANHAIDAAIFIEPFLTQANELTHLVSVTDFTEIVPPGGAIIVPLVYSETFAKNQAAAEAFMTAYMRGVRVYINAIKTKKDLDKVIEIIAQYTHAAPDVVRKSNPVYFDPNQRIGRTFFAQAQDFFIKQHYLSSPADLGTLIDTSFADAALKTLGKAP